MDYERTYKQKFACITFLPVRPAYWRPLLTSFTVNSSTVRSMYNKNRGSFHYAFI